MAPRLKVFTWSDGFHAFTVAATSRPKALEAWGSRQDLFASGLAREISNGPDHDTALASPGEVIQRGLAVDVGEITKASRPKKPPGPSRAQRDRIETLTARLAALDDDHAASIDTLDEVLAELQSRREAAAETYDRERRRLVAELKAARAKP